MHKDPAQAPPLIVFTDLDGTLLDHDSYSFAPARPALAALAKLGAPVILASSKTAAEIARLREALGLSAYPAIVENGTGVLAAHAAPDADTAAYARLREALETVPAHLRACYRGFGDLSVAEVAATTGLPVAEADLAKTRAASEPGIWTGDAAGQAAFLKALRVQGVTARRGGRFLTLSFGGTKADRVAEITGQYGKPFSLALGDAPNDVEMLETADLGIVIANPHAPPLPPLATETQGRIRRSEKPGPDGWNAEVLRVLKDRTYERGGRPSG
ncbi:HAD-IIB family hydrolase [Tropicimonas sp. S265A]|uniref:HAD-IIB family hydrolase n=1 Tax=Tropicimonas sp. S265A TaxID=3415134 RepID=UPI003C7B11DB